MKFALQSSFSPTGDQPEAIKDLTQGVEDGVSAQTLLGVTGSGKTLAYGIPMINGLLRHQDNRGLTQYSFKDEALAGLVICPTRELALQVTTHLKEMVEFKCVGGK